MSSAAAQLSAGGKKSDRVFGVVFIDSGDLFLKRWGKKWFIVTLSKKAAPERQPVKNTFKSIAL